MGEGLPEPENGLVVRFNYQWAGDATAHKDRPACVALVRLRPDPRHDPLDGAAPLLKEVVYLPISSQPPRGQQVAVEIPERVCKHLGFKHPRGWVYVSECNVQYWPSDLERCPGGGWAYGLIPPRLFERIHEHFVVELRHRRASIENVHFLPPRPLPPK